MSEPAMSPSRRTWDSQPSVDQRYQNDAEFRQLVDMMLSFMHQARFTPSELREAVIFAACLFEYRHIRPIVIRDDGRFYEPKA
jgi:hypothetical protein